MPVASAGLKMEINKFAGDLNKGGAAYVPPPIGGNPTHAHSDPAAAISDVGEAVDNAVNTSGVKDDDGKSVTAPKGTWVASAAYSFTGASAEEKPTHVEPESKDAKIKASHRCDPAVEWCPVADEKPKAIETVKVETTTTTCDPAMGCKTGPIIPTKTVSVAEPVKYEEHEEPREEPKEPEEPLWRVSRTMADVPTVATGLRISGTELALGSSIGQENVSIRLTGDQIPLCKECRFLKWYRKTTSVTGTATFAAEIQHWISGATATASELSAAAGKTASYSGGLVGAVAAGKFIQETTGSFDARVRFGISEYQVQNFSANFDGGRYTGASGLTPNDTLFNVTGHSDAKAMSASGYFFGSPAHGNTPPEIGGHFEVTGHDYHAAGVFAGSQR